MYSIVFQELYSIVSEHLPKPKEDDEKENEKEKEEEEDKDERIKDLILQEAILSSLGLAWPDNIETQVGEAEGCVRPFVWNA